MFPLTTLQLRPAACTGLRAQRLSLAAHRSLKAPPPPVTLQPRLQPHCHATGAPTREHLRQHSTQEALKEAELVAEARVRCCEPGAEPGGAVAAAAAAAAAADNPHSAHGEPSTLELLEVLDLELEAGVEAALPHSTPSVPSSEEALEVLELEAAMGGLGILSGPVEVLSCPDGKGGEATFYVLGIAHASEASCRDVSNLVRLIRPKMLMVELCRERAPMLATEAVEPITLSKALSAIASGRVPPFVGLYGWLLARVGRGLHVVPGGEFRVASLEARRLGVQVALGDRPMSITLARMWAALGFWDKARLLGSLLFTGLAPVSAERLQQEIESMKSSDVLTAAMERFAADFPSVIRPLLTERDEFMVYIMRQKLAPLASSVVVIVGAGHLKGIREKWEAGIDFDEIMRVPKKRGPWGGEK